MSGELDTTRGNGHAVCEPSVASSGVAYPSQWRRDSPVVSASEDTDSTHGTMSLSRWLNTRQFPSFCRVLNAKACSHGVVRNNGWPTKR